MTHLGANNLGHLCLTSNQCLHQFWHGKYQIKWRFNQNSTIFLLGSSGMKIIKTTEWGILFNQNPRRNHQAETLSPKDEGFLPWWFLRGFWLNRIPNKCVSYFYPVISWIYIFMGNYFCFHIAIHLRFFTSALLRLNVHLNGLSLDNHLVSKQPQWQCHVAMTSQWGHVTKQILNLAGWGQIRRDQSNDLTIIWAWYDHNL